MLASALVDRPGWQLALAVISAVVSGVFAYHYAAWRARGSERGHASATTVLKGNVGVDQSTVDVDQSLTTIDRSTHQSNTYITVKPAPSASSGKKAGSAFADWLDEAGLAGVVVLAVLTWVVAAVVANVYVDVRPKLLLALFITGSATSGLTIGAWLGVRRYRRFDSSWRGPLFAAAVICALTFADMWLLTHPVLRTGTLQEVMQPFLHNRGGILDAASKDDDATQFLALQGVGAAGALLACVAALVCVLILWFRVDHQLRGRRIRLARVNVGGALWTVALGSILCALLTSGVAYRLTGGSTALGRPELGPVTLKHGILRASVSEPGELRVLVVRSRHGKLGGSPLATLSRDCRPGRRCRLNVAVPLNELPHGHYLLSVRAVDEGGKKSRAYKRLVRVPLHR